MKKEEIVETEAKTPELQAFLQGLQEALNVLPKDSSVDTDRTSREGSNMAIAREFLIKSGHPMHIKDILRGIGKENTRKQSFLCRGIINQLCQKGRNI